MPLFLLIRDHVLFYEYAHHAHPAAYCGYAAISAVSGVRPTRPARCGCVAISSIPGVRPPRPPTPLPAVATWLPHLSLENADHARPCTSCGYVASHQSLEYAHHAQPDVAMWLLTHPRSMPTTSTSLPLPAVATWISHQSLEYAHHAQPGVAMWLSHSSLEYAHHAHLFVSASCGYVAISPIPGVCTPRPARCGYVAISPIPGVRPPRPPLCLCQLWLRVYLTYPWITPTLLPAVAAWLLINPCSTHTTPSQVYLSHLSLEYAHHVHPLPAVAISLIPASRPPHPPFYQLWLRGFSSIPGVGTPRPARCAYLTYPWSMLTTPTLCQLWLSHLSLDHAHHARPSTRCGYVALPPIPGVRPKHPAICQVWLCGYVPYPLSTPTLCQWRLRSYLSYPWSTPILLPAAATRLLTCPWTTPTTPCQPQAWWLCGHLTFHQLGFSG